MAPYSRLSDGSSSSISTHGVLAVNPELLYRFLDTFTPPADYGDEPPLKKLRLSPPGQAQDEELIPIKSLEIDLVRIIYCCSQVLGDAKIHTEHF